MDNGNTSLQRSKGSTARDKTRSTFSESKLLLAKELTLTAENSKTELSEVMIEEWTLEFSNYSPERLSRAFKEWRACSEYFPAISNIRELIDSAKPNTAQGFVACRQNGCVDGWRPVGPGKWDGYQRCQCRLDWIAAVKASGAKVDMEAVRRAENNENWKRIEEFKREHNGLSPQEQYVKDNYEELTQLWARLQANARMS